MLKNRILLVLSCIILSLCIGSIYSWSIFILPIQELTNFSFTSIQLVFCITIFTLGLTTSFGGKFINSIEPYIMSLLGSIIFLIGMVCTGFALIHIPQFIYITYGLCIGIAVGIIYLIPIPLLLQEFPNNPALGSSISILAFGFGSAIFVPLANLFTSINDAFMYIGLLYGILMIISSLLLKNKKYQSANRENNNSLTVNQALKTKEFYYILGMIFTNILIGIALISIAYPLGLELSLNAAVLVSIIGLCNGLGRPIWASIADKIGHIKIYKILFTTQIISILLLIFNINYILTLLSLFLIASCYGAGFSCCPALCAKVFGTNHAGEIFGKVLLAWGLAGLIGPFLITLIYGYFYSYLYSIVLISSLYFIGLYCSVKIKILI